MTLRDTNIHYGNVAMTLHWLIAAAVLFNIALGYYMGDLPRTDPDRFWLIQFHKSTGLSVLVLSVVRVLWRVVNPMPAMPAHMPAWERFGARAVHWAFYALILALPLAGWAMVSSSSTALPTMWYGLFQWPHIPFIADLAPERKHQLIGLFRDTHNTLAIIALCLIGLHVAAALKEQFWNRYSIFARMLPWGKVDE